MQIQDLPYTSIICWNAKFGFIKLLDGDAMMYEASQKFHEKYYDSMFDKLVKITLKDGAERVGLFNDEFYEDNSILVSCEVIKLADIAKIELVEA